MTFLPETTDPPDLLKALESLNWQEAIEVPAIKEGYSAVRIFRIPTFFRVDHKITFFIPSQATEIREIPPVWYAIYIFAIMPEDDTNTPSEIRLLRFPVVYTGNQSNFENDLFTRLSQLTKESIYLLQGNASKRKIGLLLNLDSIIQHYSLWMIMNTLPCVGSCITRQHGEIFSGWSLVDNNSENHLTVITNAKTNLHWFIRISTNDKLGQNAGHTISLPLSKSMLVKANEEDRRIITDIIQKNS